jgi:glycosyltransferase involved in cell wall biosynthesis
MAAVRKKKTRDSISPPRVAVAIPCYNEAAVIREVVERWRRVLPDADIVVFDNNSADDTAIEARMAGARVETVPARGKGHVMRAVFERLRDRPAVIVTDGDGTYPPELGPALLAPVLSGACEMSVGRRRPVPVQGTPGMAPVRQMGNRLLRGMFRVLLGRGPGDLLSGYRVFSPRMLHEVHPRSRGFEIETELTAQAVARGYRVAEVDVPYFPRAVGTTSKLRAGRDGLRIIQAMVVLALRLRTYRIAALAVLGLMVIGLLAWGLMGRH